MNSLCPKHMAMYTYENLVYIYIYIYIMKIGEYPVVSANSLEFRTLKFKYQPTHGFIEYTA